VAVLVAVLVAVFVTFSAQIIRVTKHSKQCVEALNYFVKGRGAEATDQ
jgi:hypothetical protein